jgi:hypothetical protein
VVWPVANTVACDDPPNCSFQTMRDLEWRRTLRTACTYQRSISGRWSVIRHPHFVGTIGDDHDAVPRKSKLGSKEICFEVRYRDQRCRSREQWAQDLPLKPSEPMANGGRVPAGVKCNDIRDLRSQGGKHSYGRNERVAPLAMD